MKIDKKILAIICAGLFGLVLAIVLFVQILFNQEKVLEKKENPSIEQTVQTEEKKDDTSIELKDNDDKVRVKIGKIENIENFNVQNMTVTNDD